MSSSAPDPGERIVDVEISADAIRVELADGRSISAPLAWYPRLAGATSAERGHWELAGGGYGIHWPDVDEDLSVRGLLEGRPAPAGRARQSS